MRAGLKMLKLDKILDKRTDVNITVNRIRSSVETVMCEEIETDTRLRSAMARSAQHSVSTASKHYVMSEKEGVSNAISTSHNFLILKHD